MKILFYMPHADAAAWLHDFARALPEAELREWQPGDTAPGRFRGRLASAARMLAGRDDLRAIFNLGAGVDAILALEHEQPGTLPRNAQLIRLEDTGMAPQMAEYVAHAVLRYLRRFDEYQTLQARTPLASARAASARDFHGRRARTRRARRAGRANTGGVRHAGARL